MEKSASNLSERQQRMQIFSQHCKKYELLIEYGDLRNSCPSGVFILPETSGNFNVWHGVMFIHDGYYDGSVFKFRIMFPEEYPDVAPTVRFVSDVFHPLVNSTGTFSLQHRFAQWKPRDDFIMNILHYVRWCFSSEGLDELKTTLDESFAANKEALNMLKTEIQVFSKMASNCAVISKSNDNLYTSSNFASVVDLAATLITSPTGSNTGNASNNNNSGDDNNLVIKFGQLSDRKFEEFKSKLNAGQMEQLLSNTANSGFFSSFELFQDVKSGLKALFK